MIYFSLMISVTAALATYEFAKRPKIGSIRASCILTLMAFVGFSTINYFYTIDIHFMMTLFFGATFVGMSCPSKLSYLSIIFGALIFSGLFFNLVPVLEGMGGALGLSAFLSVYMMSLVKKMKSALPSW